MVALTVGLTLAAGCASLPEDPIDRAEALAANDPFEPANRMMFAVNEAVDVFAIRPAAVVYRDFVPETGKHVIFNFVRNLTLPLTAVNDGLQGEWERAGVAMKRFLVNTTLGFGGLGDPATEIGLAHHEEDFGQTLAVHQVDPGPYIVLPLLGPSSVRHTFGRIVDFGLNPMTYAFLESPLVSSLSTRGLSIVDQRYRLLGPLDDVKENSLDYYAAVRSLYRQRRQAEIRNLGDGGAAKPKQAAQADLIQDAQSDG